MSILRGLFGLGGLLKGSSKTTVATTITRVIENKHVPNSVNSGTTKALYNSGNQSDYILEDLYQSIGVRADSFYRYGKDHYTHGLPSGTYLTEVDAKSRVEAAIASIEGSVIPTTYCYFGPANLSHIGWTKVIDLQGLNTETNVLAGLTVTKNSTVYMVDLQIIIPEANLDTYDPVILEPWGVSPNSGYTPKRTMRSADTAYLVKHSPLIKDPGAADIYFKLIYCWETSATTPGGLITKTYHEESLNIPFTGFLGMDNYFQARYVKNGLPKYFTYKDGLGTYPNLDDIYTTAPTTAGTFFPFVYFRHNKTSEISNKTTSTYLTSKKLCDKLGLEFDTVAEGINSNPDIGDVEQAMLVMAVPAVTTNQIEMRYLFDFFDARHSTFENPNVTRKSDEIDAKLQGNFDTPSSAIVIEDKRFKMALNNAGIYKRTVVGNIGPINSCTTSYSVGANTLNVSSLAGLITSLGVPKTVHTYRKQVSTVTYEEIEVVNLNLVYYIINGYSVTADEEDNILLIPLDKSITDNYTVLEKEQLYSRSLHFVFNSVQVTKIKWYQTGAFKIFMYIAAIVIAIYSGGTASTLLAQLMAGAFASAAVTLMVLVLETIIFQFLFKVFVKAVGIKAAFVLAVLATIAGAIQAFDAGSISGAPWAAELFMASTGLTAAGQIAIQEEMNDLLGEISAYEKQMKKEMELLDEKLLALEPTARLSPFIVFGETPDEFYNRTIHAGNVGIVSVDAISNYVAMQLKLPDISTINQFQGA